MGSIMGKAMSDSMEKQQAVMVKNQIVMLERQIHMGNLMRERQMSMQLARSREMFNWVGSFYALYVVAAAIVARKNKAILMPFIPLTFLVGYQFDMAHGNKMHRIRAEADRIMDSERGLLELPHGLPNLAMIEAGRTKQKEDESKKSVTAHL